MILLRVENSIIEIPTGGYEVNVIGKKINNVWEIADQIDFKDHALALIKILNNEPAVLFTTDSTAKTALKVFKNNKNIEIKCLVSWNNLIPIRESYKNESVNIKWR